MPCAEKLDPFYICKINISRNQLSSLGVERVHMVLVNAMQIRRESVLCLAQCGMPEEVRAKICLSIWPTPRRYASRSGERYASLLSPNVVFFRDPLQINADLNKTSDVQHLMQDAAIHDILFSCEP